MNPYTNFAVASYSFHGLLSIGAIDIFGYLETVKYRYGLNTADIWNGFLTSYDRGYINILKQGIDERGLTVVNLCCDDAHVWDNDPETMRQNEETAWKCIEAAEIIGAKTIRIDAGVVEKELSEEQIDFVSKKYRAYCQRAATFGAKLGTENHWGATRRIENVKKIFDAVGEENFGLLLHLGNWDTENQNQKDINDLEMIDRAMHIHIDYPHAQDAERVLPPLQRKGYSGCWNVESHFSTNEYNNVAFQLANVRRVICPMNYGKVI